MLPVSTQIKILFCKKVLISRVSLPGSIEDMESLKTPLGLYLGRLKKHYLNQLKYQYHEDKNEMCA